MRICHFLSSKSFAGIEQYVDEISQQQSKDNEVIIICGRKILSKFNKKNVLWKFQERKYTPKN